MLQCYLGSPRIINLLYNQRQHICLRTCMTQSKGTRLIIASRENIKRSGRGLYSPACTPHCMHGESLDVSSDHSATAPCWMAQTARSFPILHENGWSLPSKYSFNRLETHLSTMLILHHQWDTQDINLGLARKATWKEELEKRKKITNMRTALKMLSCRCWPKDNWTEVG